MKCSSYLMIMAGLFALPFAASGHTHLQHSDPVNGSTVSAAPDQFLLDFSESARLTALSIQKVGEADARKVGPLPTAASRHFAIPAPKLTVGVYTLMFRAVAAEDNHITSETIRFTVAADGKPAVPGGK
jgi:copper transport protein